MPTLKNAEAILSDLQIFLDAITEGTDLSGNSLLRDLSLFPVSVASEFLLKELQKVIKLQHLTSLSGADLENEGILNYGLGRRIGTKARGVVTFLTKSEPTFDIEIPRGTIVATPQRIISDMIRFVVIESKTLYASMRSNYYDPSLNAWTIDVQIEAVQEGEFGNVYAGGITELLTPIAGISSVFNKEATYGGSNFETDEQYRERLRRVIRGRSLGQRENLEQLLLTNCVFQDARAVYVDEFDLARAEGVDIYVIDTSTLEMSDNFTYATNFSDYVLTKQPTLQIQEVSSLARGILQENIHYEYIRDSGIYGSSARAKDKVRILPAAMLPDFDTLTVKYTYASEVEFAQSFLQRPENQVLGLDPLVKRAKVYYVDIIAKVIFFANADIEEARIMLQSALTAYMNEYKLGDPVHVSDIIVTMQSGYGAFVTSAVDLVNIQDMRAVGKEGDVLFMRDGEIEIPNVSYARLGSVTFV